MRRAIVLRNPVTGLWWLVWLRGCIPHRSAGPFATRELAEAAR